MPDMITATGPAMNATADFAAEVMGQPPAERAECMAKLYGLRGSASLRPWLTEGVCDLEELARLDYEPEHGAGWRDEWKRQIDEAWIILEGRMGADWPAALAERMTTERQSDMAH